jgi:GTP-binding protein YchF
MRIGIIGLSASGKSTLFNALTRGRAATGFAAGRGANIGVAHVPDARLDAMTELYKPQRTVPAEVTYVDLPGPSEIDGPKGGMFAGEALTQLQTVDAILVVVRAFEDASVPHIKGATDWKRDVDDIGFDLLFADITLIDRRIERLTKDIKGASQSERTRIASDIESLRGLQTELEEGNPLRARDFTEQERGAVRDTFLLSALPFLVAVNIGEDDIPNSDEISAGAMETVGGKQSGAVSVCASLEAELAGMYTEEEADFRESMEAGESGLSRIINLSYDVLGLISFLTVGEDEVRAWTIERDTPAAVAAGRIHSDIERGFIRGEVVAYDDLLECGSQAEARTRGLLRSEGREYLMQDGDTVNFLFSV